jgi:hypothetical protein
MTGPRYRLRPLHQTSFHRIHVDILYGVPVVFHRAEHMVEESVAQTPGFGVCGSSSRPRIRGQATVSGIRGFPYRRAADLNGGGLRYACLARVFFLLIGNIALMLGAPMPVA